MIQETNEDIFSNIKKDQEYIEESRADMKFSILDFKDYLLKLGELKQKWSEYLYNEQRYRDTIDEKMKEKYKELYSYYMYKQSDEKVDRKDVDIFIHGDKEYIKLVHWYNKFNNRCALVERILKNVEGQSYIAHCLLKFSMWQSGANT